MKKILLVEDDRLFNKTLSYNLSLDGYDITSVCNAATGAEAIRRQQFDMALLDINLPDGNGYELCRLVKAECPDTLVIFLTANDQERDQVLGYQAGAIDYITKPSEDIYDDGRLCLDFARQAGTLAGGELTLSAMEYRMLALFCRNAGRVLTRRQLLEKLRHLYRDVRQTESYHAIQVF